jgi:hypothetical protein
MMCRIRGVHDCLEGRYVELDVCGLQRCFIYFDIDDCAGVRWDETAWRSYADICMMSRPVTNTHMW